MSTAEKEISKKEKQIIEHTNIESSTTTNIDSVPQPSQLSDDTKPPAVNVSPEGKGSEGVIRDAPIDTQTNPHGSTTTDEIPEQRQVIAVSASKNPGAFFNLARRFLVTDEYVDLSALEGAIITAVDAAHLLARSKLATIVRIQTSYVAVEQKSRQPFQSETSETQHSFQEIQPTAYTGSSYQDPSMMHTAPSYNPQQGGRKGNPLRRARIVITVRKTEDYRIWLEKNGTDVANDDEEEDESVS